MARRVKKIFRSTWLFLMFAWDLGGDFCDYFVNVKRAGKSGDLRARARWLQRASQRHLRRMGMKTETRGPIPANGLLVSNHLSYMDILVLSSNTGCIFVAKANVRSWPLLGACAALGGTLFVQREKRGDVARIAEEMQAVLAQGIPLTLFPEGTSSGGETVLPFKSSLLEPVTSQNYPVIATAVDYEVEGGSVAEDVAYWRDMTLVPHLFNLFGKEKVVGRATFAAPKMPAGDRKQMARELHAEVLALKTKN